MKNGVPTVMSICPCYSRYMKMEDNPYIETLHIYLCLVWFGWL